MSCPRGVDVATAFSNYCISFNEADSSCRRHFAVSVYFVLEIQELVKNAPIWVEQEITTDKKCFDSRRKQFE